MALNLERGDFVGVLVQAVLGGVAASMNERPELFDRIYVKEKVTMLSLAWLSHWGFIDPRLVLLAPYTCDNGVKPPHFNYVVRPDKNRIDV